MILGLSELSDIKGRDKGRLDTRLLLSNECYAKAFPFRFYTVKGFEQRHVGVQPTLFDSFQGKEGKGEWE